MTGALIDFEMTNNKLPALIDDIDLSLSLAGMEGLDVNYVSRIRSQYLFAQHQSLLTQTQFADAKAIALLTLIGLALFRGPVPIADFHQILALHLLYLTSGVTCVLTGLLAVLPRYPTRKVRKQLVGRDKWSWPALAAQGDIASQFGQFMQTAEVSQLIHSVSASNAMLSKLLLRKFRMLRTSFFAAMVSFACLVAKVVLTSGSFTIVN